MRLSTRTIPLFTPHVPPSAVRAVQEVLRGRWIGQGPQVERFETLFRGYVACRHAAVAVGAGTDALHLAYLLAGIGPRSEVITPVFTCVATNVPLLYQGATIRFADVQPNTLNVDPEHVRRLVNERTKAIVCVHYGGLPCDLDALHQIAAERGIPVIEDAAQALGAVYQGQRVGGLSEFTAFSFQAIKHVTTGDGGMLMVRDPVLAAKACRLRWFGIDRKAKLNEHWKGDITEIGYKYQMTDVAAVLGIEGLKALDAALEHRRRLFRTYCRHLADVPGIEIIGGQVPEDCQHAAWLFTIKVDDAAEIQAKLRDRGIESAPVHHRNDRYAIFASARGSFPNMDALEGRYLSLPLHSKVTTDDVEFICEVLRT